MYFFVPQVVESGISLAFITYPTAVLEMKGSQVLRTVVQLSSF